MGYYLVSVFLVVSLSSSCFGVDWEHFQWLSTGDIETNSDRLVPLGWEYLMGDLYYCRAKFQSHFYPGKFYFIDGNKNNYRCIIPADGQARDVTSTAQVLYTPEGSVEWVAWTGRIQEGSIAMGSDATQGSYTYLCRVDHSGHRIMGRVIPWEGRCYFPYGRREESASEFEMLTVTPSGKKRVELIVEL